MDEAYHIPVMLKKSVDALNINPNGIYVDVTFGGGGHSREILNRLESGKLIAFDRDSDAEANRIKDERFIFVRNNFRFMCNFLKFYDIDKVDGILADLGVSSHQFDQAMRGFSFRYDSVLDMRMNKDSEFSAGKLLNTYSESELKRIFSQYGELEKSNRLAHVIVEKRANGEIRTTNDLLEIIKPLLPQKDENKFLAKFFQAIRIEVNKEMDALKQMLESSAKSLKTGGRLVIITYHSLEDRLVKNFMKSGNIEGICEKDFYGNISSSFETISRKAITPDAEEISNNSRARSAKLRIAQKR